MTVDANFEVAKRMADAIRSGAGGLPTAQDAHDAAEAIHEVDDAMAMGLALQLYAYAGNLGDDEALHQVAFFHEKGQGGLKPDMAQALALYTRSAELGNLHSQMRLAEVHEHGQGGISPNLENAKYWLQQAAKHPHAWEAQYRLGLRDAPAPPLRDLGFVFTSADAVDVTGTQSQTLPDAAGPKHSVVNAPQPSSQKRAWWKFW